MAIYYVATTGSDGNPGSSGSPWLTLSKALATAVAGDTVRFRDGVYSSAGSLSQTNNGTVGSRIIFMSDNLYGATLLSTDVAQQTIFISVSGANVTFSGFNITCPGNRIALIYRSINAISSLLNVYHVADFEVDTNGGAGIDFANNSGYGFPMYALVDRCKVTNIGGGYNSTYTFRISIQGIYLASPNITVQNCIVADIGGFPIHAYHGGSYATVINNTAMRGGGGGILIGTDVNYIQQGSVVKNNIVKDTGGYGIRDYEDVAGTMGSCIYDHNNVIGSTTASYFFYTPANTYGNIQNVATNQISSDPLFVNYQQNGYGDYRLQAGSPDINAGDTLVAPTYDYYGVSRPQGSAACLGAIEYVPPQSNKRGGLSLIGA